MTPTSAKGVRQRFIMVALGSAGDVLPFVAVGQALRARGFPVCIGSNPRVESLVRTAGLDFMPIGSLEDADRTELHPRLWHPVDGFGVLWRHLVIPALQASFGWVIAEASRAAAGGERLTVLASPLAVGARVARECTSFELVSVSLAPMNMAGLDNPMFIGPWRLPFWWPGQWRSVMWRTLERYKLAPLMHERFLPWREAQGLPPLNESVFGTWLRSPDLHQAWFPDWFAPVDSAWAGTSQFDFPLIGDPELSTGLPPEDADWLASGPPVVVVYPGSGRLNAGGMVNAATEAVRRAGLRSLVVSRSPSDISTSSSGVRHVPRARFDLWLPRAAAIVHHGGIGTVAQALRAGCRQLIWPSSFDQHENAWHVEQLQQGTMVSGLQKRRWRRALDAALSGGRTQLGCDGREQIAQALIRL